MMKAVSSVESTPLALFQTALETASIGAVVPKSLEVYVRSIVDEASNISSSSSVSLNGLKSESIFLSTIIDPSKINALALSIRSNGLNKENADHFLSALNSSPIL